MVQTTTSSDAKYHLAASGIAAVVNFPLWRASAINQSGFKLQGSNIIMKYVNAVMQPPYKGVLATMLGMTWARACIFYGSEIGKQYMISMDANPALAQAFPPFLIGTAVQVINMPLVRATITIQDPSSDLRNVRAALIHIYKNKGIPGLWHGVSAGILKTVPKYITAVAVKDYMEDNLPKGDPKDKNSMLTRSAIKSVSAGIAGAVLTNPLDVIRNEMFKTDLSLTHSVRTLINKDGWKFMLRGITSNVTAVAVPIAVTIFVTDVLVSNRSFFEK